MLPHIQVLEDHPIELPVVTLSSFNDSLNSLLKYWAEKSSPVLFEPRAS